jgi:signal transduction histidine kinase
VKLDDLLRDAYNNALPRAQGKAMKMDLQMPREMAAVSIDKDMFRIALNNLVTNAIKYNEPGGAVSLIAEEGEHDVVITVKDSGIGIAQADQPHVFEKFYRARESGSSVRGGHGLGLYLTAQIIELHHGRVTLRSELGQGSEFSIHLKKMPALLQGANVL